MPMIHLSKQPLGLKRPQQGVSKPKGTIWSAEENAVLRAYAAGEMSYAELCVQLPVAGS